MPPVASRFTRSPQALTSGKQSRATFVIDYYVHVKRAGYTRNKWEWRILQRSKENGIEPYGRGSQQKPRGAVERARLPLPNITNVFYGRDVGYNVERIVLDEAPQVECRARLARTSHSGCFVTTRLGRYYPAQRRDSRASRRGFAITRSVGWEISQ